MKDRQYRIAHFSYHQYRHLILLFLVLANLIAQSESMAAGVPQGIKETIEVTDFRDRTISVQVPLSRVVCLIESALTGIYMLGAEQSLVGISTNIYSGNTAPYYAQFDERIRKKQLPTPGNWDFVNIESVVALQPDLVIIWAHQQESIKVLEDQGIPVFGVELDSFDDVFLEITRFGQIFQKEKRASELIEWTKKEMASISTAILSVSHKPSVYYMWAQGKLETSGKNSTVEELLQRAGTRNIASSYEQEHLTLNLETLILRNPEYIVMWYNEQLGPDDIYADSQFAMISAVRKKQVYEFPDVFFCDLWTLKFIYAIRLVAFWCHKDSFTSWDPELEKAKMMQFFYKRPFKKE